MRRTKEEAEQTRRRIMRAALRTFNRRGIARTTLEEVARSARVTRGAIYWHFAGKQALLRAIRDDVSLPLIDQSDFTLLSDSGADPLTRIERFLLDVLRAVEEDPRTRLAFCVMSFKCEYVGELAPELDEFVRKNERLCAVLTEVYTDARLRKALREGLTPRVAALGTLAFLVGLLRLWLLDEGSLGLRGEARQLVAAHVAGQRPPTPSAWVGKPRSRRRRSGTGSP